MAHDTTDAADREGTPTMPDPAHEVPHLEVDESLPPRPEEEIADVTRSDPAGTGTSA